MYNMELVTNRLEQHTDITMPACTTFEGVGLKQRQQSLWGQKVGVPSRSYSETDTGGVLRAFVNKN